MQIEKQFAHRTDGVHVLYRPTTDGVNEQERLVRDILALANHGEPGQRFIIFGIRSEPTGTEVVGLTSAECKALRELFGRVAEFIEPSLVLQAIFERVAGRNVAALEISGCDDPPYVVCRDVQGSLRRGECWVIGDTGVRPAIRQDLDRLYARRQGHLGNAGRSSVSVGIGEDPDCLVSELCIPARGALPSQRAADKIGQALDAKRVTRQVLGADDSAIGRLVHARLHGPEAPYDPCGTQTLLERQRQAAKAFARQDLHYRYEETAARLNFTVRNNGPEPLAGAIIEFVAPRLSGFDIAERLFAEDGELLSNQEAKLMGYPHVSKSAKSIRIRARLGDLDPGAACPAFGVPLRLLVGAEMAGMKVALRHALQAQNLATPVRGRVKLKFRL